MKRGACIVVAAIACVVATAQAAIPPGVAQALAAAGIPTSAVGIYVQEVGAARPAVSYNSDRALNPASTMKLVTTFAALELLGPAFAWTTEVYATTTPQNEVLNGDLVIRGSGDPKLTFEQFWLLLRGIRARGIRDIRGDLVFDRSFFAPAEQDPGAFDEQPLRPYNTLPDALLVNFKAIAVHFAPDVDMRRVRITTEPPLPNVEVVNNVTLTDGNCGDWASRLAVQSVNGEDSARLIFGGGYARDCGERTRNLSVLGHRGYVGALFRSLWQELGGSFSGRVRDGAVPVGARPLVTLRSPALSEVVRDINKFSNNVMARQLFLTLGAIGRGAPGTNDKARGVVQQWLAQKAVGDLFVENGSGLSRHDRISARSLALLLLNAYGSAVMPELMASLPVVAADGTMRKRLGNAEIAGQAHIKTGSLVDVRSIAGYVLDSRGRRNVVVLIVNHPRAAAAQAAQDALLRAVHAGL